MPKKRWEPGAVIRKKIGRHTHYARLLEFPWAAFYDFRTERPIDELSEIVSHSVAFTVAAHKSLVEKGQWEPIGRIPLEPTLRPPKEQAMIDVLDPDHCQIIDDQGNVRDATREECEGLEPAAVWEPDHIADRLEDHFAGRPARWLKDMIPPRP